MLFKPLYLIVFVLISACQAINVKTKYDAYLKTYEGTQKDYDPAAYKEHLGYFDETLKTMRKRKFFTPYPMEITYLSDFSQEDLESLMIINQNYTGVEISYNKIDAKKENATVPIPVHAFKNFGKPTGCSTSWVSAILNAGEYAINSKSIDTTEDVKLSPEYIFKCYIDEDEYPTKEEQELYACNGPLVSELIHFIIDKGMMSQKEYDRLMAQDPTIDVCTTGDVYYFDIERPELPNRGGLMNLISSNISVIALTALNLTRLKFVKDMTTSPAPFMGAAYRPTLFGLVTGYQKETKDTDGYWMFKTCASPYEVITAKLPMRINETSTNYAAIAAYAFGIKASEVADVSNQDDLNKVSYDVKELTFMKGSFNVETTLDLTRFKYLKELVFEEDSCKNVEYLNLTGKKYLEYVTFEKGAFKNSKKLILDKNPSFTILAAYGDNFNGQLVGGRRLADVDADDDASLVISDCENLISITIGSNSFNSVTKFEIKQCPSLSQLFINADVTTPDAATRSFDKLTELTFHALPSLTMITIGGGVAINAQTLTFSSLANVESINILDAALTSCNTMVISNVTIATSSNLKAVFKITESGLPMLKTIQYPGTEADETFVNNMVKDIFTGKDIVVESVSPSLPTDVPTTETPTTEALTTEAPTTEALTTEAPTTEAPTTEAPTTEAPQRV